MKIKSLLAVLSLGSAFSTQAAITDWGIHLPTELGTQTVSAGNFSDVWKFTLPTPSVLGSTAVALNVSFYGTALYNIDNGLVNLYQDITGKNGTVSNLIGSYGFNGNNKDTFNFGELTTGDYHYQVSGSATGVQGGLYTLVSSLKPGSIPAPVPEPETYALMGLGLAAMLLKRKKAAMH